MANITSDMLRAKMRRLVEDIDYTDPDANPTPIPDLNKGYALVRAAKDKDDYTKALSYMTKLMDKYGEWDDAHMDNVAMILEELAESYRHYVDMSINLIDPNVEA